MADAAVPFVPAEKTAVLPLIQAAGVAATPSDAVFQKVLASSHVPATSPPPSFVAPPLIPLRSQYRFAARTVPASGRSAATATAAGDASAAARSIRLAADERAVTLPEVRDDDARRPRVLLAMFTVALPPRATCVLAGQTGWAETYSLCAV